MHGLPLHNDTNHSTSGMVWPGNTWNGIYCRRTPSKCTRTLLVIVHQILHFGTGSLTHNDKLSLIHTNAEIQQVPDNWNQSSSLCRRYTLSKRHAKIYHIVPVTYQYNRIESWLHMSSTSTVNSQAKYDMIQSYFHIHVHTHVTL